MTTDSRALSVSAASVTAVVHNYDYGTLEMSNCLLSGDISFLLGKS